MLILDPSFGNLTTKYCHNLQWAEQIYVATSDKTLAKCLLKVDNSHTANEEFFALFLCLASKLQLKAFLAISIVLMDNTHLLALSETRCYVGITLFSLFFSVCYEDACFGIDKNSRFC